MLLPAGGEEPNTHENAAHRSRDALRDAEGEAEPQNSRQEAKQEVPPTRGILPGHHVLFGTLSPR